MGSVMDRGRDRNTQYRIEKLKDQVKRMEILGEMYRSVGFGNRDYSPSLVEKEVAECLTKAYELLELLTRSYRHELRQNGL